MCAGGDITEIKNEKLPGEQVRFYRSRQRNTNISSNSLT